MSLKASQGDLADLPAVELIKCFQDQSATPVDATQAALDRIDRFDAQVNAFVDVDRDGALKAAEESTKRWQTKQPMGPLDGVPTTIKDIVWIKGYRTGFGSDVLNMKEAATEDAPCVARLREAGAVFLGTTHTPENGWKALTDSPSCGITRNPWNTDKTPGGSSGGAAAAAALGMGALHVGTDGGGSIRIPSAFTGITGIKPSFGRVPAYPASAFGTVAHVGPMARTVDDLALMLMVLAGADSRDWFSMPANRDFDPTLGLGKGVRGLRIAYSPALGYVDVDPEIAAAVHKAALSFEQLGAHVEEVDPGFDCPLDTFHKHWFSGAMNRTRDLTPDEISKLDPGLIEIIEEARSFSLQDYLSAMDKRAALGHRMRVFHDTYDLLLTPTVALPAFDAGLEVPAESGLKRWTEWASFSYPFNLTQQPACSIPCGFTSHGLPIGLQIVGPMFADELVLRAAKAFEDVMPSRMPGQPNPDRN